MVHIYYGNGKGKTSSAAGLCLRAISCGVPVIFVQFLKDGSSGEARFLEERPNVTVLHTKDHFGFWRRMTDAEKEETARQSRELLIQTSGYIRRREIKNTDADISGIIVLDEVLNAVEYGIFDAPEIRDFIKEIPCGYEAVLTGKNAPQALIEEADYVTELKMIKHPYEKGVKARCGVEK
ncbi:MAG: cob(I)yrinic acid a,c-diamide adenosyltransferase [Lachnospiraceae bacterium]|nr:cob(I)yrinic acid a,c-diamide adenosyltransferase [Lachnospiraceae bacterium]